jgi:hypothetical protein
MVITFLETRFFCQSMLMGIELNVESLRNWSPFVMTEILFTWKALYLGVDFQC